MKTLFIVLSMTIFSSCTAQQPSKDLQRFRWVLGKWEMKTPKGTVYEYWVELNDSTFQGKNFKLTAQKDTVILETVQLAARSGRFYYIPTVSDQNNQEPVRFEIKEQKTNEFVAQNPQHDFPQHIGYKRNGDALKAWIGGTMNGKYRREDYPFQKM